MMQIYQIISIWNKTALYFFEKAIQKSGIPALGSAQFGSM